MLLNRRGNLTARSTPLHDTQSKVRRVKDVNSLSDFFPAYFPPRKFHVRVAKVAARETAFFKSSTKMFQQKFSATISKLKAFRISLYRF